MIKAYTVKNYWECKLSKQVIAKVFFQMGEQPVAVEHLFPDQEYAAAYLKKEAKDWFMPVLETFINHKRKIAATKEGQEGLIEQIDFCWNAYVKFENLAIEKITAQFIKGYDHFKKILPHPANTSYESSLSNLAELEKFCVEFQKLPL